MQSLIEVTKKEDIFPEYRDTPIGLLLEYHNLERPFDQFDQAQLLIGMCMDNRKKLNYPDNFAYCIRTGGANIRLNSFQISYAVALGNVKHIVLMGHDLCGMAGLAAKKEKFVSGLVNNGGWEPAAAEEHFNNLAPYNEISNEITFLISEVNRLQLEYPKVRVAPLFYKLDDHKLYQVKNN